MNNIKQIKMSKVFSKLRLSMLQVNVKNKKIESKLDITFSEF